MHEPSLKLAPLPPLSGAVLPGFGCEEGSFFSSSSSSPCSGPGDPTAPVTGRRRRKERQWQAVLPLSPAAGSQHHPRLQSQGSTSHFPIWKKKSVLQRKLTVSILKTPLLTSFFKKKKKQTWNSHSSYFQAGYPKSNQTLFCSSAKSAQCFKLLRAKQRQHRPEKNHPSFQDLTDCSIQYTILLVTSVRLQLVTSISVALYSVANSKSINCDIFVGFLLVRLFRRLIFIEDTETWQAAFVCSVSDRFTNFQGSFQV